VLCSLMQQKGVFNTGACKTVHMEEKQRLRHLFEVRFVQVAHPPEGPPRCAADQLTAERVIQ
jgi:hypothetical protein